MLKTVRSAANLISCTQAGTSPRANTRSARSWNSWRISTSLAEGSSFWAAVFLPGKCYPCYLLAMADQSTPQFTTAEYSGNSGGDRCVSCNQPLTARYYRVNTRMACEGCVQELKRRQP